MSVPAKKKKGYVCKDRVKASFRLESLFSKIKTLFMQALLKFHIYSFIGSTGV
jgi:hypothetical protein